MFRTMFSNWHTMRVIRLALSIIIIIQAISMQDKILGAMGTVFMLMAAMNVGCCSTNCQTPETNTNQVKEEEITYEEIK